MEELIEINKQKLMKLLKVTSECSTHYNNLAKEYLIKDDKILTLGQECFKSNGRYFEIVDNKVVILEMGEYTICYGISISNITSMLEKGGCKVISIIRDQDTKYNYYSRYYISVKSKYPYEGRIETYSFKDDVTFRDFCASDLFYYLLSLYNIE